MTTFRISDPDLLPDLLEHLGARQDVVAARIDRDTIRVSILGSYSRDAMDLTADLMVRAWEAAQRAEGVDVRVELEA
jgi:DNA-directed RNA polymerase specialized sigma24 family protein